MKERPILFSSPMVRAILEGRKSQTRRTITLARCRIDGYTVSEKGKYFGRPVREFWADLVWNQAWKDDGHSPAGNPGPYLHVPYPPEGSVHRIYPPWFPGDLLWVRETWCDLRGGGFSKPVAYRADSLNRDGIEGSDAERCRKDYGYKWTPSIFMPRWASRITLRITNVRVERLQEISREDIRAEGVGIPPTAGDTKFYPGLSELHSQWAGLWEQINGPGSWDLNPWVWVIEFERVEQQKAAA